MRFCELSEPWQRVFTLAWESVKQGSKAIAAVIADENGKIISEGRNRVAETYYPNPLVAHAENEAVMKLDTAKYPRVKEYTLYAGLEPCPMCMGTIVMGHIRHIVIAARDGHGGAVDMLNALEFMREKNMDVRYEKPMLGYIQRCFQAIREIAYNPDERSRLRTLEAIRLLHGASVDVADELVNKGLVAKTMSGEMEYEALFDIIADKLNKCM